MSESIRRLFQPVDPLKQAFNELEADVVGRTKIVREGIQLRFLERKSGDYLVLLERRTKPLLKATFLVEKSQALTWRDFGEVPSGEVSELFAQFQLGTWPER